MVPEDSVKDALGQGRFEWQYEQSKKDMFAEKEGADSLSEGSSVNKN